MGIAKWVIGFLFLYVKSGICLDPYSYKSFDFKKIPEQQLNKIIHAGEGLGLTPVFVKNSGSPFLGINLVLSDAFLNSKVIFKYDVKGSFPINKVLSFPKFNALHFSLGDNILAIYFSGISPPLIYSLAKAINSKKKAGIYWSPIKSAHAQACPVEASSLPELRGVEKLSQASLVSSIAQCARAGKQGAYDSTIGTYKSVTSSLSKERDRLFSDPKKRIGEYLSFLGDGLEVLWDFSKNIGSAITDFEKTKALLIRKYGEFGKQISEFYSSLSNMTANQKLEATCLMVGSIGVDVLIAALTAGAASPKVALTMGRLVFKMKKVGNIIAKSKLLSFGLLANMSSRMIAKVESIIEAGQEKLLMQNMEATGCEF
ncbi:MAG: hypothetical protein CME64_05635 [Halobacteriovoraceae bacterium]|nr:hypothetical protein [Halobacteriovoraceae bacterium]|tara:strand:+ start:216777 stop:217892 length:1116 start_codon:yes stop_codon:yes gene_type:complete